MKNTQLKLAAAVGVAAVGMTLMASVPASAHSADHSRASATQAVGKSTLSAGEQLMKGESITSPDGRYKLIFQQDSNLVLYGPSGSPVWFTGCFAGADRAVVGLDGNLTVRNGEAPLWSSDTKRFKTEQRGALQVVVTDDGRVQIKGTGADKKPFWENGTALVSKGTVLNHDDFLGKNEFISSPNDLYELRFQTDSNLVLSGPSGAVWSTDWSTVTEESGTAERALMRGDGNLIIRDDDGNEWSSDTARHQTAERGALQLVVTDDGKAQIRGTGADKKPVWENGTALVSKGTVLKRWESLSKDEFLTSPDGAYKLHFQDGANLVLSGPKGVVWNTGLIAGADRVEMYWGDLIIRTNDYDWRLLWSSKTGQYQTAERGALQLVVTDDGKAQIRGTGADKSVVWQNGVPALKW